MHHYFLAIYCNTLIRRGSNWPLVTVVLFKTDYPNLLGTRPTASQEKKGKKEKKKVATRGKVVPEKRQAEARLRRRRRRQPRFETTGEYGSVVDVQRLEYEYRGQREILFTVAWKSDRIPGELLGSVRIAVPLRQFPPIEELAVASVKISLARFQTRHLLA